MSDSKTTPSELADWLDVSAHWPRSMPSNGPRKMREAAKELLRLEKRVEKLTGHLNWLRWSSDEVQTNKQQKKYIAELESELTRRDGN